jgi:uncharacterized protein (DUF1499 family)
MTEPRRPALVNWTGYIAITLLLLLPIAVLMVRSGVWQQGLLLYAVSCLGAALVLLISIVLLLLPRYAPWRAGIAMRAACVLPGTLLLLSLLAGRGDYPPIHDNSTDTEDPPVFSVAGDRRGSDANTLEILEDTLAQQEKAYPGLDTLVVDTPIDEAFARALEVATAMGWEVYHQDINAGVLEAVDTTAIMGFKDDIVIRLRSNADGTLVDLRSVSRVGVSDLGANASRIKAFQREFAKHGARR